MNNILRGQQIARKFAHGSRRPDVVRLQKYVESDYPNAIAAGFVNCSFSEYEQRLAGVIAGFEQQGIAVKTVTMTVADILATLRQHGIPNTPDGRALAIGLFRSERLYESALNMIFEKPRYRVRAVGFLVAMTGIIFANIEKSLLATTLMIVGSLFVVGGLYVELLALATLAFNTLRRASENLHLSIEQARERWAREGRTRQADESEKQSQLAVAGARRQEVLDVVMPTKQTTNTWAYYPPPFKAKVRKRRRMPEWRACGGTVLVRTHRRRLPRRSR